MEKLDSQFKKKKKKTHTFITGSKSKRPDTEHKPHSRGRIATLSASSTAAHAARWPPALIVSAVGVKLV